MSFLLSSLTFHVTRTQPVKASPSLPHKGSVGRIPVVKLFQYSRSEVKSLTKPIKMLRIELIKMLCN